jgi:hypothetical protein
MAIPVRGNQEGFSLPIIWILIAICIVLFLVFRYNWWWLGVLVVLFVAVAMVSAIIGGRKDAAREGKLDDDNPETEKLFRPLRLVLYSLYHIRNIEEASTGGYLYDIVPEFTTKYSPKEQDEIINSIKKVLSDKTIDLTDVHPNVPFGNDDIRRFLSEVLIRLRKKQDPQKDPGND